MFRPLSLIVIGIWLPLAGCGPSAPLPPASVGPRELIQRYQDAPQIADDAWFGQRIEVALPKDGYTVIQTRTGWEIGWSTGMPKSPPVIVFIVSVRPDGTGPITVTGRCRGLIRDGVRRGPGIDWHVLVTECTVVTRPAP